MEVETVELDCNGNCTRETSIEHLFSPDSSEINNIFGDSLVNPRIGDKFQVNIPSIISESEHLKLLTNPNYSEIFDVSHPFLMGLPIPIMWIHEEANNIEDKGLASPKISDDAVNVSESDARNGKKNCIKLKKKSLEHNVEPFQYGLEHGRESRQGRFEAMLTGKRNFDHMQSKSGYPVPGLSSHSWSDAEVDSFLLGLYIFGKNFFQIQRFMETKDMGKILSFYYGKFYRSHAHRRWSDCRKIKRRKYVTGRKIFTGWRQQELLSRLFPHVPEEVQNTLLEGYKSFSEGSTSLEEYVTFVKSIVGIQLLVEAVAIGKGKEDLTGFALEPAKINHDIPVCPKLPTGQACSSLTSNDIVQYLTGGFRLSKARCNDIFWEAVWPRLLAKGWHSEQPKNLGYISSKHYLVFLIPGIKKFSRTKLVKGDHYFDSVSDVLNKVASEPNLLELDSEESPAGIRNEEDALAPEVMSDQDELSDRQRHCYLKPRVSTGGQSHVKFTIVDTSLVYGGKSSSIRELRHSPVDFKIISKETNYSGKIEEDASEDELTEHETFEKLFHLEKAKHNKRVSDGDDSDCMRFTVVDTSLVHGGKSPKLRQLRYLPTAVQSTSELTGRLRKTQGNSFMDSVGRHGPDAIDVPLNGKRKNFKTNWHKDTRDGDGTKTIATNSDTAKKMVNSHQDQNAMMADEKHSEKTILHQFSRRAKSGHPSYIGPLVKRRRLTACAKAETSHLTENCSRGLGSKRMEIHETVNSPNASTNVISSGPQEKGSSITSVTEDSPEKKSSFGILGGNCVVGHLSQEINEKHQTQVSSNLNLPEGLPDSRNSEVLTMEEDGGRVINMDSSCCHSEMKKPVPGTLRISTDIGSSEQDMNHRRQSTRNRPLTIRALESLENGFLNVQRRAKSTEGQKRENPFSNPSRKARSRVKITSNHSDAVTGPPVLKEDKDVKVACNVNKEIVSKTLDKTEGKWLGDFQSFLSS
ncbi:uncharacterized protein LOC107411936 isoform X1 [Ziziphus jujuba]|uniref:Uncharacterized protein LOC107411936 isoform X1 n=2 Tax=Ziziphus jujuba TaxID=326968 RepID=A0ABM3IAJ0_ZIZJJ|nr:uncharacterized protein LOC107411936 isoform X1 [Ziziphus jujuba]